jgi:hypothetical protein
MKMVQTKKKPVGAAKKPVGAAKKPVGAPKNSGAAANKPKAAKKPVGAAKKPVGAAKKPVGGAKKPVGGAKKPGSGAKKPAAKKTAAAKNPVAAAKKPLKAAAAAPKRAAAATAAKKGPGAPSGAAAKLPPRSKAVPKGYAPTARLDEAGRKVYTRGGRDYVKRKRADGKMGMRQTTKSKKFVGGTVNFNEIYRVLAARRENDPNALEKLNDFVQRFQVNGTPDNAAILRKSFEENFMEERASKLLEGFQALADSVPDFMNNEQFKNSLVKIQQEINNPLESIDLTARKQLLEEEERFIEALTNYNTKKRSVKSPNPDSSSESLYPNPDEVKEVIEAVKARSEEKLQDIFKIYNNQIFENDDSPNLGSPPRSESSKSSQRPSSPPSSSPSSPPSSPPSSSPSSPRGPGSSASSDSLPNGKPPLKPARREKEDYDTMLQKLFKECNEKYRSAKTDATNAINVTDEEVMNQQKAIEDSFHVKKN